MRNLSYISRGLLRLIIEKINNQCWCKSVQLQGLYWHCQLTPAEDSVLTPISLSQRVECPVAQKWGDHEGEAYGNVSE